MEKSRRGGLCSQALYHQITTQKLNHYILIIYPGRRYATFGQKWNRFLWMMMVKLGPPTYRNGDAVPALPQNQTWQNLVEVHPSEKNMRVEVLVQKQKTYCHCIGSTPPNHKCWLLTTRMTSLHFGRLGKIPTFKPSWLPRLGILGPKGKGRSNHCMEAGSPFFLPT